MPARLNRFLLLACFAFWACGAALYLHERLEHGGGAEDESPLAASAAGAGAAPAPEGGHDRPHHHDHDKCPVCQALTSMKADRASGPVLLESHRPLAATLHPLRRRPPVVFCLPSAPIRGPPGLS